MTRSQLLALALLGVLFLVAAAILTIQLVWGSGSLNLDELPGS
jgi:hypothetical protein